MKQARGSGKLTVISLLVIITLSVAGVITALTGESPDVAAETEQAP